MSLATDTPLTLPKPQWRTVTSLGHVIDRSISARTGVLKRLRKEGLNEPLAPWLAGLHDQSLPDARIFMVALEVNAQAVRLKEIFDDPTEASSAMPAFPLSLTPSKNLESPVWGALFKLRPLRPLWALEMRSNLLETLDRVSTVSCLLDPAPLPPGSSIAGLEITDWKHLIALRSQRRSFRIDNSGGLVASLTVEDSVEHWETSLQRALEDFPERAAVLTEMTALADASAFYATYERKDDRVDLLRMTNSLGVTVVSA